MPCPTRERKRKEVVCQQSLGIPYPAAFMAWLDGMAGMIEVM
ncbi:MAG: hypothetical protein PVF77_18740 [Anaerolineae bacterium]|jgi:hypothetical protein